jgi:hypothetical protein
MQEIVKRFDSTELVCRRHEAAHQLPQMIRTVGTCRQPFQAIQRNAPHRNDLSFSAGLERRSGDDWHEPEYAADQSTLSIPPVADKS